MTVDALARIAGADVAGDGSVVIGGLATLEAAAGDELSFARSASIKERAQKSGAGALVVPRDFGESDRPLLVADQVHLAVARITDVALEEVLSGGQSGVHEMAIVSPSATMGEGVTIGPGAVIDDGVVLGAGVRVGAGCYVGRRATIGDKTLLHANVTVCWGCIVGARCILHAGAVVGSDGFGYHKAEDGSYIKINQIGNVILEDDVEIGACACVDRAILDSTVIERGVKLDNLVHIAHNCRVGQDTAMAAQVGVAGSTTIGEKCELGGQVGVAGHLAVGSHVRVGAASAVIGSVRDGLEVWGFPAREKSKALREMAGAARAGKLAKEVKALRRRLAEIERVLGDGS
jgi:UDP-3-O-[3-hydroxymyristoyl] glucosamine N-acyltransferase